MGSSSATSKIRARSPCAPSLLVRQREKICQDEFTGEKLLFTYKDIVTINIVVN